MNTTITVAEGILFCLILLLGGCIAARTGRLLWAVMTVWLSLVLISMPLASVNMAWVEAYAKAGTARSSAVERDRLHDALAGKVFQRYRAAGGSRRGGLPDFFIGAHAAVSKLPILTRDTRRYATYFSGIDLISP